MSERKPHKRKDREGGNDGAWAAAEGGCCLLQIFAAVSSVALLVLVPMMII